jgi:hypothetical protein
MHKIYLASPFGEQKLIHERAKVLESLGYIVTAKWLSQEMSFTAPGGKTVQGNATWDACYQFSIRDIHQVFEADTLIHFPTGLPLERNTHVAEMGGALFAGLRVIVIAPPERQEVISSIFEHFHTIPDEWRWDKIEAIRCIKPVIRYNSWQEFLTDILNPISVECCAGCGEEYRKRDCGCPAGSFHKWKTKDTNFNVLKLNEQGVLLRDSAVLANVGK